MGRKGGKRRIASNGERGEMGKGNEGGREGGEEVEGDVERGEVVAVGEGRGKGGELVGREVEFPEHDEGREVPREAAEAVGAHVQLDKVGPLDEGSSVAREHADLYLFQLVPAQVQARHLLRFQLVHHELDLRR